MASGKETLAKIDKLWKSIYADTLALEPLVKIESRRKRAVAVYEALGVIHQLYNNIAFATDITEAQKVKCARNQQMCGIKRQQLQKLFEKYHVTVTED